MVTRTESRTLELVAEGTTLGDHFVIRCGTLSSRVRLSEPFGLDIILSPVEGGKLPASLTFERGTDAGTVSKEISGEVLEDGSARFPLELILKGQKGSSILRILVKSEEYRATLAITELPLEVGSAGLKISARDPPPEWDPSDKGRLELLIENENPSSLEVMFDVALLTGEGREVFSSVEHKVSLKDERSVGVDLLPTDDIPEGSLDARIDLSYGGDHQTVELKDAIRVVRSASYQLEDTSLTDDSVTFLLKGGRDETPANILGLLSDGRTISPDLIEMEGGLLKAVFGREDLERPSTLELEIDGRRVPGGLASLDEGIRPPDVKVRCEPDRVLTGDGTKIVIDARGIQEGEEAYAVLKMDRIGELEIGMVPPHGHVEKEITIEAASGDIGGSLRISRDGRDIFERSFSRLVTIRTKGGLALEIVRPPGDAEGPYLFPGESLAFTRKHSDLTVSRTTLGRIVIMRDGKLLPENEEDRTAASRTILHETFLEALLSGRTIQRLEEEFSATRELSGVMKDLSGSPSVDGGKGFASSLAKQLLEGEREPALKVHCEDGKDPVVTICALLRELSGKDGISSGGDPAASLRDQIERTVRSLKGSTEMIPRSTLSLLLSEISKRGSLALVSLRKLSNARTVDSDAVSTELRKLLFHLLAHSLVRAEMVSRWSDPLVSAWDELRVERQRAIKGSVQSVMDAAAVTGDIHRAASGRWEAYSNNVERRRKLAAMKELQVSASPTGFGGTEGEVWSLLLTVRTPGHSPELEITPHLTLPGGGWTLEHPRSVREGDRFVMETMKMKAGERRDMELKVRSPPSPPEGGSARIYFHCADLEPEEEP